MKQVMPVTCFEGIRCALTNKLKRREIFSVSRESRSEFTDAGWTSVLGPCVVSIGVNALTKVSKAPLTSSTSSRSSFKTLRRIGKPILQNSKKCNHAPILPERLENRYQGDKREEIPIAPNDICAERLSATKDCSSVMADLRSSGIVPLLIRSRYLST
jgi:hypothetical protein